MTFALQLTDAGFTLLHDGKVAGSLTVVETPEGGMLVQTPTWPTEIALSFEDWRHLSEIAGKRARARLFKDVPERGPSNLPETTTPWA